MLAGGKVSDWLNQNEPLSPQQRQDAGLYEEGDENSLSSDRQSAMANGETATNATEFINGQMKGTDNPVSPEMSERTRSALKKYSIKSEEVLLERFKQGRMRKQERIDALVGLVGSIEDAGQRNQMFQTLHPLVFKKTKSELDRAERIKKAGIKHGEDLDKAFLGNDAIAASLGKTIGQSVGTHGPDGNALVNEDNTPVGALLNENSAQRFANSMMGNGTIEQMRYFKRKLAQAKVDGKATVVADYESLITDLQGIENEHLTAYMQLAATYNEDKVWDGFESIGTVSQDGATGQYYRVSEEDDDGRVMSIAVLIGNGQLMGNVTVAQIRRDIPIKGLANRIIAQAKGQSN
jgi:hypothetical protein